ncbi:MAG: helix-turn-helix transcriptional regulator [Cognatishimia sp.]
MDLSYKILSLRNGWQLKDLVQDILSCSTSPEGWEATLDTFNEAFQISASCMFSVHEFREFRMNFAWSGFFRRNLTTEISEMMQSGGDVGDRPGYLFLNQRPAQTLYDELTMFGVDHHDELPHSNVRDVTDTWGFCMRVAAALNKTGPWIDGIFFQHRKTSEWKRFIGDSRSELILPIMANSVSLGRTMQALQARYKASLSVLDSLGLGVFLVDATGCVIEHNKEAQRIIDASDGLSLNFGKRLVLGSPDQTSELDAMISVANELLRGDVGRGHSIMASVRPSGAYDYLISVRALSDGLGELEVGLKCAFVTVIDPERKNALSAEGIATLGQLSNAESAVVSLLIQGFRPAEVAEQRDVSLNTIKTQLRVISQKLRCSTQSDIIRVAAVTNLPIDK